MVHCSPFDRTSMCTKFFANLIKEEITEGWPGCLFAINENWAFLYFISVDLGARIFIQDDNFSYDANN